MSKKDCRTIVWGRRTSSGTNLVWPAICPATKNNILHYIALEGIDLGERRARDCYRVDNCQHTEHPEVVETICSRGVHYRDYCKILLARLHNRMNNRGDYKK